MRRAVRLVLALSAAAAVAACGKEEEAPKPVRPVLSVIVEPATTRSMMLTGTVQPRIQTDFGFRVLGRLIARPVNVGDLVEKGQTLATIDPIALDFAVRSAAATLSNSEAQLANTAGIADRQRRLLVSGAATQATVDSAEQALAAAQAGVTQAKASLAKAKEQLGYAVLHSDYAGVVTATNAEIGQVVAIGQTVVSVAQPDLRDVVVDVPDAIARDLGLASRFTITLQLNPAIRATGKVREIAPDTDAATRTRRVKVGLDDPPDAFRLGTTVSAVLSSGATVAIRLPATALLERDGRTLVWVVDPKSHTVSSRDVRLAPQRDADITILSGVEPGMRVVTAGVHGLVEGQSVRIGGDATGGQ
jgi:RND family efflux transporter MFP subunit